jgi:hypothetical protein
MFPEGILRGETAMRTTRLNWSAGSVAAVAAVIAIGSLLPQLHAQVVDQPARPGQRMMQRDTTTDANHAYKVCKASELIGMNVRGREGDDNVGSINDLVIGADGRINYAAVSFGGFLGMGDKLFAVPFEAIDVVKTDDDAYARIDVTEETLKEKKGFNQENWPTEADRTFGGPTTRRQAATMGLSR